MGQILVTDDLKSIPRILDENVDLVAIRRPENPALKQAIETFNVAALDPRKFSYRGDYIDGNRLCVSERDAETRAALLLLWEERRNLRKIFKKAFGTKIAMTHAFIQPAIREESRDYTFHRDYATGMKSKADRKRNEVIFMTVAHKGFGTEVIPGEDAGRPTPFIKDNRTSFYHPKDLSHLFCGATNDILVMKSGKTGTIHRAPHRGEGLRWWTFFNAGPIGDIRRKSGKTG